MIPVLVAVDLSPVEVVQLSVDRDAVEVLDQGGVMRLGESEVDHHILPAPPTVSGWHAGQRVVGTRMGAFVLDEEGPRPIGPRTPVAAVTGATIVYRDGDLWPGGHIGRRLVDGVDFADGLALATADGALLLPWGTLDLGLPAADLAVVDGVLKVAAHTSALEVFPNRRVVRHGWAATSAGEVWGLSDGTVLDADGRRLLAVDEAVRAAVSHRGTLYVGTGSGLHTVGPDARTVATAGLCGGFVTGVAEWEGRVVVGTFDRGACVQADGGWAPIDGLPSTMINEVAVHGGDLWLATAGGLVQRSPDGSQVVHGRARAFAPESEAGLHHHGANDLAVAVDNALWVADLFGPVEVREDGGWRRWRLHVTGRSYQAVSACGDGSIWLGSEDDGLAVRGVDIGRRNGRSPWRHVNQTDGLPQDWVMALACAGPGAAWVGTYNRGVGRLDVEGWHPVAGLERAWVQALAVERDALWVGTADGLFVVREGVVAQVGAVDVHELVVGQDTLWVGARSGLWKVDLKPM
jgi:ligand-binding sensor domain-containing protein